MMTEKTKGEIITWITIKRITNGFIVLSENRASDEHEFYCPNIASLNREIKKRFTVADKLTP